jgi:hypothetical protein
MTPLDAVAVVLAGAGAGAINAVVGSGTLITFPVLLLVGYSPVVANASNTLGLVPGAMAGAYGYRADLTGQGRFVARLALSSVLGGTAGAVLFLVLPAEVFKAVIPILIGVACVLVTAQPRLAAITAGRPTARPTGHISPGLFLATFLIGIYGGYFGGGQGIMLLAVLGLFLRQSLQKLNGMKNLLAATANLVAAVAFTIAGRVAWEPALLIAAGSTCGGIVGARYGRRFSPAALRGLVVVVGVVTIARLA